MPTTHKPYREWTLRARIVERLYRWTHGGRIRTLVVPEPRPFIGPTGRGKSYLGGSWPPGSERWVWETDMKSAYPPLPPPDDR